MEGEAVTVSLRNCGYSSARKAEVLYECQEALDKLIADEALREEEGELKAGIEERRLKMDVIKAYIERLAEQNEVTFKDGTKIRV